MIKRKTIIKIFSIAAWVLLASGVVVLLVSAVRKEQSGVCSDVKIDFAAKHAYKMLDEAEVLSALFPETKGQPPKGKKIQQFNLLSLEKQLEKNPWVKKADLYFDQQRILHIDLEQRTPVARLFTPSGNSFFLDNAFALLPLKSNDMIDLPVFTNFYINPNSATASDTLLMERVTGLATFILSDPFWMAQIESVNINSDSSFELYTQMGDQLVTLGQRRDWPQLFYKLKTLYAGLQSEGAWGNYKTIDLQYKDQAVCVRKADLFSVVDTLMIKDTSFIQNNTQTISPVKNKL